MCKSRIPFSNSKNTKWLCPLIGLSSFQYPKIQNHEKAGGYIECSYSWISILFLCFIGVNKNSMYLLNTFHKWLLNNFIAIKTDNWWWSVCSCFQNSKGCLSTHAARLKKKQWMQQWIQKWQNKVQEHTYCILEHFVQIKAKTKVASRITK